MRPHLKCSLLTLFSLLAQPLWGSGQKTDYFSLSLEELLQVQVVTAAVGYEQPPEDAPASVSIIDRDQWRAMGIRTAFEAIEQVPGVHVSKTQTGTLQTKVIMRGLSGSFGEQALFMIDGVPFRSIIYRGPFVGQRIPLAGISRIEVINSPGSAVYGADAFGGIINLVSYDTGELPSEVSLRYGSFGSKDFLFSHSLDLMESSLQFALEIHSSDDDKDKIVFSDQQTAFDNLFDTNASLAPGSIAQANETRTFNAHWNWEAIDLKIFSWSSDSAGLGGGVAQALDPTGITQIDAHNINLTVDLAKHTPLTHLDLKIGKQKESSLNEYTIFPQGTTLPIGSNGNVDFENKINDVQFPDGIIGEPGYAGDVTYYRLTQINEALNRHKIRWEIGFEEIDTSTSEKKNFGPSVIDGTETIVDGTLTDVTGTEFIYMYGSERDLLYASIQDEWEITESLYATLGARIDDYSDFGSTFNPRIGIVWKQSEHVAARLFAGSAYRAPSFIELYTANNPAALGNPDLEPEAIDTIEAGISLSSLLDDTLNISTTVFHYHATDIIEFVTEPTSGLQKTQNIGKQDAMGIELSARWRGIDNISVEFNYSYLHSEDRNGSTTADIPGQQAHIGINWSLQDEWNLYAGVDWIGDRDRPQGDLRESIDDNLVGRLSLRRQIGSYTLQATLNNLFDNDIREPSNGAIPDDYPQAGRSWILDLSYSF